MSANTSTIDLIDDFIPVDDDHEARTRSRRSSAVHIKVFRVGARLFSEAATSTQKAVAAHPAVAEDCVKMPIEARTSEDPASQQQNAVSKSQKKSKRKPPFSKTQST